MLKNVASRSDRLQPQMDFAIDVSPTALVNVSTQMQQTAQILVLKQAMEIPGHMRAGAATGPAVGHEWPPGHSGQHDGVDSRHALTDRWIFSSRSQVPVNPVNLKN